MTQKEWRKRELEDLADFIATENGNDRLPVDVAAIAEENGITYCLGDYQNYFDGMLEYEDGKFHIYLNNYGGYTLKTPRLRFSFAHELGHYFIDEHRLTLESGKSLHHPSKYCFVQRNPVEKEADHFASCLLMPRSLFEKDCQGEFSFEKLDDLSKRYGASLPATASRYMEYGSMPIAMVCAKDGIIQYKLFSEDFPYKWLKTNHTNKVPLLTCAGDYFENDVVCESTEEVEAKEWFSTYDNLDGVHVYEHCVYQKNYGRTLSILWFG